jgi:uncharacterized protein
MFGFRRRLLKNEIASTRKFCRKFVNKKVNRPIVLNRSNAMITVKSTRSNIFASIFFALSIEAAALVSVHAQSPGRTITVIGTGAANAVASSVSLQLTVTSQDVTATGLFVKQKDVVDRLEQAMEKAGVSSKNISEEPFRLMPNVEYGQQGTRIIGYRMDTPINLQVDNVKDLPRFIDLATANGAGTVSVGSFGSEKGASLHEEAVQRALANAKKEAATMAKEMGKTVGDIISISEMAGDSEQPMARGGEEEERRVPPTPGQPNMLSEKAEVRVVFELH